MPEKIVELGIKKLILYGSTARLGIYLHSFGSFATDFPQSPGSTQFSMESGASALLVSHEEIKFLNYDGIKCNTDENYHLHPWHYPVIRLSVFRYIVITDQ